LLACPDCGHAEAPDLSKATAAGTKAVAFVTIAGKPVTARFTVK